MPQLFDFAEIRPSLVDQIRVGAAVALTLGGVILQAIQPRVRMTAEEKAKDRILTESEARHRVQIYRWCANIMTLAGVTVLIGVVVELAQ